jgi:hypothetical protein
LRKTANHNNSFLLLNWIWTIIASIGTIYSIRASRILKEAGLIRSRDDSPDWTMHFETFGSLPFTLFLMIFTNAKMTETIVFVIFAFIFVTDTNVFATIAFVFVMKTIVFAAITFVFATKTNVFGAITFVPVTQIMVFAISTVAFVIETSVRPNPLRNWGLPNSFPGIDNIIIAIWYVKLGPLVCEGKIMIAKPEILF